MLTFYMTPGSCSTGIHILLEELDQVFQVQIVDLLKGDQKSEKFISMNPKSSIPVLVTGEGRAITEFQAIAYWLARKNPKAKLLSDNLDDEVRIFEVMEYAVSVIHMQGFARIFTTDRFVHREEDFDAAKERGREIIEKGFSAAETLISGDPYVLKSFSIADAALFYTEFWADRTGIPLPPKCKRHYDGMLKRMKVKQVLKEEGYNV